MNCMSKKLTIIIPVYNESSNIFRVVSEISKVTIPYPYEILFINDGSTDDTELVLKEIACTKKHVFFISFVRNYGHQMALKAGMDAATGDGVISMDGDLQHPPSLIPLLIRKWEEGFDIVITKRQDHKNIPFMKKAMSALFYKVINALSSAHISYGEADFRFLDKKVVAVFKKIHEPDLFWRGMVRWVGFKSTEVSYQAEERFKGESKYTFKKMVSLALNGILSFSTKPLYFSIYVGFGCAFTSILVFIYVLISFFSNRVVPGWTSTLIIMSFFSGVQLVLIGIIGLYIGKLFVQVKDRPLYIINESTYGNAD